MDHSISLEKKLLSILQAKDFGQLQAYKNPEGWNTLSDSARDILASLFMAQGEHQLHNNEHGVQESFSLATQVSPNNKTVFYKQASVYASQENNLRCLTAAIHALQYAVELDSAFFEAWFLWGKVLISMGLIQSEHSYFEEADEKFKKAFEYASQENSQQLGPLHWNWGRCWYAMGQISGEAHDYHQAMGHYRLASYHGVSEQNFCNDYGNCFAALGTLLGRREFFHEAIEQFQKVAVQPHPYGLFNLACTYQRLFEIEHEEHYFKLANEAFESACEHDPSHTDAWLSWGRLFSDWGKIHEDLESLKLSAQKFAMADECESNHPVVLSLWAESCMLCGAYEEKLDLLREAEEKIIRSLELNSENVDAWRIYGTCLTELARYFGDENLYETAIEKYNYGLSINSHNSLIWYGLALAHFALGDLRNDKKMIEKAIQFCAKVVEVDEKQPAAQFWNDWGVALMRLAELTNDQEVLESAIDKFAQALGTDNPEEHEDTFDIEWLYNYGCALDYLGDFTNDVQDYEKAVSVLTLVVQQDPTYTQARYNLALALTHVGEISDDIEAFTKALEHYPLILQDEMENQAAWNDWGMTLLNAGRMIHDPIHPEFCQKYYQQAEEKLMHAIALGCNSAFYNLACLYSLMGNYNAAMHYVERAEGARALPSIDEVLNDEWLEGVRETSHFRNFITERSSRAEPTQEDS